MSDNSKKFHEFALQTVLFKGRPDWYFCYLKAEKIAHVLSFLAAQSTGREADDLESVLPKASLLPGEVAHLAGGEIGLGAVLADAFGLMTSVRLLGAKGSVHQEHARLLVKEYEEVALRLVRGSNPSPFVSTEDLRVTLPEQPSPLLGIAPLLNEPVKDIKVTNSSKRHYIESKGQSDRMSLILELVRKRKSLSIKEIASVIKDCSEKTIQRELNSLIEQGLIRREGERRWSVYIAV